MAHIRSNPEWGDRWRGGLLNPGWRRALRLALVGVACVGSVAAKAAAQVSTTHQLQACSTIDIGPGSNPHRADRVLIDPQRRRLYVAMREMGILTAIDLDEPRQLQRWPVGASIEAATLDRVDGTLYVSEGGIAQSEPQVILVLDGQTGARLRAVATPYAVNSIGLDRELGLLIAASSVAAKAIGMPHLLTYAWPSLELMNDQFVGMNASVFVEILDVDPRTHEAYTIFSVWSRQQIGVFDMRDLTRRVRVLANSGTVTRWPNHYPFVDVLVDVSRDRILFSIGWPPAPKPSVVSVQASVDRRPDGSPDRRRIEMERPGPLGVDERTGIVYVASAVYDDDIRNSSPAPLGTLAALHMDTQRILGTVQIGRGPHAVAVDPTDSSVYVTNQGDGTLTRIRGLRFPDDEGAGPC
jgi:hypothetical protein